MDQPLKLKVHAATVAQRPLSELGLILLASGSSKRMGQNKLMLPVGKDQKPCIRVVAEQLCALGAGQIVVLYKEESVRQALSDLPLQLTFNPLAALGQSEAIKLGVGSLWPETIKGWVFVMGDQPLLSSWVCRQLMSAFLEALPGTTTLVAVPVAGGQRLSPAVFARSWERELLNLQGDQGAKKLLTSAGAVVLEVEFEDPEPFEDMDSPEAYERLRQK